MSFKQKLLHILTTVGVVVGIVSSPLVAHFLPAEASAVVAAVSYALKQLIPLFSDTPPTPTA